MATKKTATKKTAPQDSPSFTAALDKFAQAVAGCIGANNSRNAQLCEMAIEGRTNPLELTPDKLAAAIAKYEAKPLAPFTLADYVKVTNRCRGVVCDAAAYAKTVRGTQSGSPNAQKELYAVLRFIVRESGITKKNPVGVKVPTDKFPALATEAREFAASVMAPAAERAKAARTPTAKAAEPAPCAALVPSPDVSKCPDTAKGQTAALAQVVAFNRAGHVARAADLMALKTDKVGASAQKVLARLERSSAAYQSVLDDLLKIIG